MTQKIPATGGGSYTFDVPLGAEPFNVPADLEKLATQLSTHLNSIAALQSKVLVKSVGTGPVTFSGGKGTLDTGQPGISAAIVDYGVDMGWTAAGGPPQLHVEKITNGVLSLRCLRADGSNYGDVKPQGLSRVSWVAW